MKCVQTNLKLFNPHFRWENWKLPYTHPSYVQKKRNFPTHVYERSKKKGHDELPYWVVNQLKSPLNFVLLLHNFSFPSFLLCSIKNQTEDSLGNGRKWRVEKNVRTYFTNIFVVEQWKDGNEVESWNKKTWHWSGDEINMTNSFSTIKYQENWIFL